MDRKVDMLHSTSTDGPHPQSGTAVSARHLARSTKDLKLTNVNVEEASVTFPQHF